MEQKLSDTLVKAIDRSNPMMQNLQLASRFNKLIEEGSGSANLEDNKEVTITENGEIEITPSEGKDGMKKVTATVDVAGDGSPTKVFMWYDMTYQDCWFTFTENPKVGDFCFAVKREITGNYDDSPVYGSIFFNQVSSVGEHFIKTGSALENLYLSGAYDLNYGYMLFSTTDFTLKGFRDY